MRISADQLRAMWIDPEVSLADIGKALDMSPSSAQRIAARLGLPGRWKLRRDHRSESQEAYRDPTPAEIEERKKEVWEMRRKREMALYE